MTASDSRLAALAAHLGDEIFVIGLTWSDEGKGKIADELAAGADATVRYHGGGSAGHNIERPDGARLHLRNLPCGLARGVTSIAGPMCALDPEVVQAEIAVAVPGTRILIDPGARVVIPAHKIIDAAREGAHGAQAYGTTKTGMAPVHEDLFGRKGLTVRDLALGPDAVRERLLERGYDEEKRALAAHWGAALPGLDETVDWASGFSEMLRMRTDDTRRTVAALRRGGKRILWEGAHGAMIDVVNGTMPTSSLVGPYAAHHCYGPPRARTAVVDVFRPYVTRTGAGPMPTEMRPEEADVLHRLSGEIESTTARKQRCGWLDLRAIAQAARLTGTTHLVLTKMDAVPFGRIKVCVGYEGVGHDAFLTHDLLAAARPTCDELAGWDDEAVRRATSWQELPLACQTFVRFVEWQLGLPVVALGNGPVRGQIILLSPPG